MPKSTVPPAFLTTMLVIYTVAKIPSCTISNFQEVTGMCPMTFRRGVRAAETVLGIKIRYIRHVRNETDSLTVGNSGYYVIDDWGCVNKKKFLAHVEQLIEDKKIG